MTATAHLGYGTPFLCLFSLGVCLPSSGEDTPSLCVTTWLAGGYHANLFFELVDRKSWPEGFGDGPRQCRRGEGGGVKVRKKKVREGNEMINNG